MKRFWAAFLFCLPLAAQVAEQANRDYNDPQRHRAITQGLVSPGRDAQQKPLELIKAMDLKPGMRVADVGTGPGYMLPFLSRAVGESGRVIAEDIQDDTLGQAKKRAAGQGLSNVTFVKGTERDPGLPAGCCDVLFVLDAYHHFDYPQEMLDKLAAALAPGGRLIIVEYYKNKESMPGGRALQHIRLDEADMIKEIQGYGWALESSKPFIEKVQYMAVFTRK